MSKRKDCDCCTNPFHKVKWLLYDFVMCFFTCILVHWLMHWLGFWSGH
jgi:hypothetical protein